MVSLRLWIAGGVVLMIAGLVALVLIQRAKLETAAAQAETAAAALVEAINTNREQSAVIDRLTQQRAIDDRTVAAFNRQLAEIRAETTAAALALETLKEADPDAKAFLSMPVPDSIRRLLAK